MAAKKSARKTTGRKKTATVKAAPKKKTAAKKAGSKKKAAAAKATPKKKTAALKKGATKKAATRKKASTSSGAAKRVAKKTAPRVKPKKKAKERSSVSSMTVNLGHVFALRPRVSTSFPPANLLSARHLLQDDDFATISDAARAVAEKALELTHKGSAVKGFKRGR